MPRSPLGEVVDAALEDLGLAGSLLRLVIAVVEAALERPDGQLVVTQIAGVVPTAKVIAARDQALVDLERARARRELG